MSKQNHDVYIVKALRSPVCKANKGGLANARPDDILSAVLRALINNCNIDNNIIDDIIIGCAMPEAEQGMNVARVSSLLAGLPESVPAMTINRFCSSGLQAISLAADRILTGQAEAVIAGGVESMSMVPMGGYNYRPNLNIFNNENIAIAYGMGLTAEIVAEKWSISRDDQDEFAYNSHIKSIQAINDNLFKDEIVPIRIENKILSNNKINKFISNINIDDGPRQDTSIDTLSKLRPVFKNKGSVTAGNSSQISDGAAALLLVNKDVLNKYNLQALAKFKGYSVTGLSPEIMGVGPVTAIPKCLEKCNLKLSDLDWVELNEAFAAQSLAVINELQISQTILNPYGGAIALGHPLGATGAVRACTMLHGMQRNNLKYGMVTMCIGTGMGAAGVFEKI